MAEETRLVRVEERLKIKIGRNDYARRVRACASARVCFYASVKTRAFAVDAVNPGGLKKKNVRNFTGTRDHRAVSPCRALSQDVT